MKTPTTILGQNPCTEVLRDSLVDVSGIHSPSEDRVVWVTRRECRDNVGEEYLCANRQIRAWRAVAPSSYLKSLGRHDIVGKTLDRIRNDPEIVPMSDEPAGQTMSRTRTSSRTRDRDPKTTRAV